jgi:hypothetical protein
MKTKLFAVMLAVGMMLSALAVRGQTTPPSRVSYQGRVMDNGQPHHGWGYFKFALCDPMGTTTYWSNSSGSAGCGEPMGGPAQIIVDHGLYTAQLGDGTPGMAIFPPDLFTHGDLYLRIWFSRDGIPLSYEQLDPLQPVNSVFNALNATMLWGMTPGKLRVKAPNTVYVAPVGGDTTTITGGLALASASVGADVVVVAAGSYAEDWLFVPSDVTVQCVKERECILTPPGGMGFILMGTQNVKIEGFVIDTAFEAIRIDPGGAGNIEIVDNEFRNCQYGVNQSIAGSTIDRVTVRRNQLYSFTGAEAKGVVLRNVNMAFIEDNNFSDFSGGVMRAIDVKKGVAVTVRGNIMGPNQGFGGGPDPSCNIALGDVTFGWITDNKMKDPSGMQMKGICVYDSYYVKISGNDLVMAAPMPGSAFDGIYADGCEGISIEDNRVINFQWPDAIGIRLRDPWDYRVTGNQLKDLGDPMGGPPNAWAIVMEYQGMPPMMMSKAKQVIADNQIERCRNGIRLDYSLMSEMWPLADKVIKGNVILDGHSVGDGILLLEADNVQVLENKVVGHKYGLRAQYMMTMPNPLHVMRNEFWMNTQADLDLTAMGGVMRVLYNFMDVYNRPLGGTVVEAYNVNRTGGTP